MVQFEELQQLWQNQPVDALAAAELRQIARTMRTFRRRQNLVNTAKLALIAWQGYECFSKLGFSFLVVAGELMLLLGMFNILFRDWKTQLGIANLDFSKPSAGFIEHALQQLNDPNAGFRKQFWMHMALIGIGLNLLMAARWSTITPGHRFFSHLVATAAPFLAFAIGLRVRTMRYRAEYRPIREKILAMKCALGEPRE